MNKNEEVNAVYAQGIVEMVVAGQESVGLKGTNVMALAVDYLVILLQRDELLDELEDMVNQHCSAKGVFNLGEGVKVNCELDSMALSANATAMRLLAKAGRIKIETEYGRRIGANWIPQPSKEV